MTPLHSFTRGGQLVAHQFRMLKHISIITGLLSFLSCLVIVSVLFFHGTTPYQRYLYARFLMAEFNVHMSLNTPHKAITELRDERGRVYKVRATSFLKNPEVRRQVDAFEATFVGALKRSLCYALLTAFLVVGFFVLRGYRTNRKHLERGGRVMEPRVLRRLIRRKKQASDLTLDGLPLLKNKETSYILITGTTGSGKTNCFHTLLPRIRKRGNRAIVVDLTGDLPVTKIQMKFKKRKMIAPAFHLRSDSVPLAQIPPVPARLQQERIVREITVSENIPMQKLQQNSIKQTPAPQKYHPKTPKQKSQQKHKKKEHHKRRRK